MPTLIDYTMTFSIPVTRPVWLFAAMSHEWHERRQREDNEMHVWLGRAATLAACCNTTVPEIIAWQKDSGLCPSDFWYLANVINSRWMSYDEMKELEVKINEAIAKARSVAIT